MKLLNVEEFQFGEPAKPEDGIPYKEMREVNNWLSTTGYTVVSVESLKNSAGETTGLRVWVSEEE
jgi:glycine cleavage system protein P-like pyridoxal-binding family